jgi:hypothetical protein
MLFEVRRASATYEKVNHLYAIGKSALDAISQV